MGQKEKKTKREIVKALKRKQFAEEVAKMPISCKDLNGLFQWLTRPDAPPCSHTLNETMGFLSNRGLNEKEIILWLNEYGGYCDCEVIYNVEDKWGEYAESL